MRKALLAILIFSLLLIPAVTASAQGDPAAQGAAWLLEQQFEDGSFGGDFTTTAFAAMALAAYGEPNADALAWLENYITTTDDVAVDKLSIALLAVLASKGDLETFAEGTLFTDFMGQAAALRGENVDQLCGAMTVLPNAGTEIPPTAVQGIVALQNEDGGFGVAPNEESNIGSSTICTQVLAAAGETDAVAKALEYLQSKQNEDHGWSILQEGGTDAFGTGYAMMALTAAGEDLADWGNPENVMLSLMNPETGEFNTSFDGDQLLEFNLFSTALAILNFRGKNFVNLVEAGEVEATSTEEASTGGEPVTVSEEGPALDANWEVVGAGFGMSELNTADDFFITVVDPFTQEELYGVEIVNWTAEYTHTGFIVEGYLPAEVLLWMAEQDSALWENISDATLQKLPADVLAQLPEDVQARVQ